MSNVFKTSENRLKPSFNHPFTDKNHLEALSKHLDGIYIEPVLTCNWLAIVCNQLVFICNWLVFICNWLVFDCNRLVFVCNRPVTDYMLQYCACYCAMLQACYNRPVITDENRPIADENKPFAGLLQHLFFHFQFVFSVRGAKKGSENGNV